MKERFLEKSDSLSVDQKSWQSSRPKVYIRSHVAAGTAI